MSGMTIERDETRERIERAAGGDRATFDALCQQWHDRILVTIRQMIGGAAQGRVDPDDVVQDVLATAWTSLGEFRWQGSSSFRRWLEGIARHRVLHLSRRELRRAELLELHRPAPSDVSASRDARRAERFEQLKDAVDALHPEYREVIRLARIEGRSIREIATSLGKTESAVKNQLLRAMKALRETVPETESLTLPKDRQLGERPDARGERSTSGSDDDGS